MIPTQLICIEYDRYIAKSREVRLELERESDDYLQGIAKVLGSQRFTAFHSEKDVMRLNYARQLPIERDLVGKTEDELKELAKGKGFWGDLLWKIKNYLEYDPNYDVCQVAGNVLWKKKRVLDSAGKIK